jgi:hypothetical protein
MLSSSIRILDKNTFKGKDATHETIMLRFVDESKHHTVPFFQ